MPGSGIGDGLATIFKGYVIIAIGGGLTIGYMIGNMAPPRDLHPYHTPPSPEPTHISSSQRVIEEEK
jgi:hypothetical protein